MIRIAIATLVCWGLALFLGYVVAMGLRTGKIRHSDSSSFIVRAKNPAAFWALVVIFLTLVALCLAVWLRVVAGV
jgi:hypothetical protein